MPKGYPGRVFSDTERVCRYRRKLRQNVIAAYGGMCACCGERNEVFLVIDHLNGGGNAHRRRVGGSSQTFYRWLRDGGYPAEFRVLCQNCNWAVRMGGCPHQESNRG